MSGWEIRQGDALTVLQGLESGSVQCCVTSPPYWGLRDYGTDGQLGLESTPAKYVAAIVGVFREVSRVLRDDGTLWLNLGDSYSGGTKGDGGPSPKQLSNAGSRYERIQRSIAPNLANGLNAVVKGQPLVFGNPATIGITAHRVGVSLQHQWPEDGVLLSLLGVERITIKQRNNDFCQVLHTFNRETHCRISAPVAYARRDATDLEIVIDATDSLSIVIADLNPNAESVLSVSRVGGGSAKDDDAAFAIKEPAKPITEVVRDGESIGNAVSFDAPLKRLPDVYFVDQAVPFGNGPRTTAEDIGDFRVSHASREQVAFTLGSGRFNLRAVHVSHLFALNQFGSLVRYGELYDKANRWANANRPKQELGIPEMVKRALMEDGWICRSTIIWSKPNPMPESVIDRPTKSHEYIFLLTKSERYFYDAQAIAEPAAQSSQDRAYLGKRPLGPKQLGGIEAGLWGASDSLRVYDREVRNRRSVWTVSTKPFAGAHFATYPPKLVEPCILAGTSERGCCPACGAPWVREIEKEARSQPYEYTAIGIPGEGVARGRRPGAMGYGLRAQTTGWAPSCTCNAGDPVPCLVLDPFAGASTTGVVATRLGRRFLGIELSQEYVALGRNRIIGDSPMFNMPAEVAL